MFQLNESFLVGLGLGDMPTEEKKAFLAYLHQELVLRVGAELSKDLSDEQLAHFEQFVDAGKKDEALGWLEKYCPTYEDVVKREMNAMREEIIAGKDRLLNAEPH
jgi:hypothetical protein